MRSLTANATELEAVAGQVLQTGSTFRFRAGGASMRPFIRDGDVLEVQPINAGQIRWGDVVLCRDGKDRLLAHRVRRVYQEDEQVLLQTRGDALTLDDGLLSGEQVLGQVVAVDRQGRRIRLDSDISRHKGWLWSVLFAASRRVGCSLFRIRRGLLAYDARKSP